MEHQAAQNHPAAKIHKQWIAGVILFFAVAIVGLFWAKWNPYFHKVFVAASEHSIGSSIVSGDKAAAADPSLAAAWEYSLTYFKSIWKAFVVAIVLASLVQVALPANWIRRVLGKTSFGSTVIAGLSALPGMMCTCCTAPIVVGLRKQKSSVSAASAFWLGNPALNPAVLIFMFFILGWKFTLLRLVFGILIVFGLSYLAGRFSGGQADVNQIVEKVEKTNEQKGTFLTRWLKSIGILALFTIPAYLLSVFVLGGLRAWLFPAVGAEWGNSILMMIFFAIVGTLFVIPTSAEIPIIQTMMSFGLGGGPAAVLAIVLPVISLPSALMVQRALSWRVLVFLGTGIAVLGFCAGLIGMAWI
ncbi:MAG: permease [Tuberibacillus sp.]